MRNHIEWLDKVTRGDSNREIARRAEGVSDATLSRQRRAGELSADLIIKIAEAYNESPVVALVDLGFMSAKWITEPGVITALSRATDEELTDELLRRLNLLNKTPVDELAARRNSNTPPMHVAHLSDDEIADAIREANELQGAAQQRTEELTEPEST